MKKNPRKLIKKTTIWEYDTGTVYHSKVYRKKDVIYFCNDSNLLEWDKKDGYGWVDISKDK